jgi:hypothetical protein
MGKSIDPMWKEKAGSGSRAHSRRSSASMSLQPAIPWRVALQQCPEGVKKSSSFRIFGGIARNLSVAKLMFCFNQKI